MIENDDDETSISTSVYSEYSDYDCDNMYEPEEISSTKYNIVLAEIYNDSIHGVSNVSEINNCYIVLYRFKQYKIHIIDECIDNYLFDLERWLHSNRTNHSTIRNYNYICFRIKPEIAECVYVHTGECVCVFKTFWLRLIQRTWKKIYNQRCNIIRIRALPTSQNYRQQYNKWPDNCSYLPSIQGLLSNI